MPLRLTRRDFGPGGSKSKTSCEKERGFKARGKGAAVRIKGSRKKGFQNAEVSKAAPSYF